MTNSSELNSDLEVYPTSTKTKHKAKEYSVRPCTDNASGTDVKLLAPQKAKALYTISKGQTRYYSLNIGSAVNWIEVALNWGVTNNSLSLNIHDPARSNLGTYFDNADGKTDGKIHLSIYPSERYVTKGTWMFAVKGESVSGSQSFTIIFYTH